MLHRRRKGNKKFNSAGPPPNPTVHWISAMRQIFRRSLDSPRSSSSEEERAVAFQEAYQSTEELRGTQEEAARAYDIAAIEYRGINAVTNFDLSSYTPVANWWKRILMSKIDGEDTEHQLQMGNDDEYARILYDGNGDIPFVLSSSRQVVEFQGELHFTYNDQGEPLGAASCKMPSM
ncbi:unnamed protein product [Camellia sinensis]